MGRIQESGTRGGTPRKAGKRGEQEVDKNLALPQEHAEMGQQGGEKGGARLKVAVAEGKRDHQEKAGIR